MRLLVILSPTEKWGTKTEYTRLRNFLHKGGYIRIAPEVFMRIVRNRKASEKHYRRIEEYAPKTGAVRPLRLTEKQYNSIYASRRTRLSGKSSWYKQSCHDIIRLKMSCLSIIRHLRRNLTKYSG